MLKDWSNWKKSAKGKGAKDATYIDMIDLRRIGIIQPCNGDIMIRNKPMYQVGDL